tara:strand:- start:980 stop:1183 length:204 start_codon:yes stop_codon:yes gene_type:complete
MDNLDRHSGTWQSVTKWLQDRRQQCVESLINGSPNDDKLRGEIRVIDDLIANADDTPAREPLPDTDY